MAKRLPPRPDLAHLKKRAKALLAALLRGDDEAAATFRDHLPAAAGASRAQILAAGYRLADAQSALARQSGFGSWPQLGRHVEMLRGLEGTWSFASLAVGGTSMPAAALATSRILIDGDRFRTESPEAVYEGEFDLDVGADPHHLDIHFVAGPEAGVVNRAIFRLDGDDLEICLDPAGGPRPRTFASPAGGTIAHERLRRSSAVRPANVTGGTPPPTPPTLLPFPPEPSPLLAQLQGEWTAVEIVRDGQALPPMMCRTALRTAVDHDVQITFGGQVMVHASVRLDERHSPVHVDYRNLGGAAKGTEQAGLFEWRGDDACFCMGAPGQPRPGDFSCEARSGRTRSVWRRKQAGRR